MPLGRYSQFLNESGFKPKDEERWLHHRGASRVLPLSLAQAPVTYVSLDDARAFCKHYGKRLPHSWEWQWVAGQAAGAFPSPLMLFPHTSIRLTQRPESNYIVARRPTRLSLGQRCAECEHMRTSAVWWRTQAARCEQRTGRLLAPWRV